MVGTILLSGSDGFTGLHLTELARSQGYRVHYLQSDITDIDALNSELAALAFDFVVHLAGISAVTHDVVQELYRVNLFGTLNLLSAVAASGQSPEKVIIASSANVYGDRAASPIKEDQCPNPVNHYAMSKLAMEQMARAQGKALPLVFCRPFNYTGAGHDLRFVIPKLVDHFTRQSPRIELGNLEIEREFNDVRAICRVYMALLNKGQPGEVYNVCSGRTHKLSSVIELLSGITGHEIQVEVNPAFLRENELLTLSGDPSRLQACLGDVDFPPLRHTLQWMLGLEEN